ncbi:FecR family protein [Pedobacter westerhofensis]|uniref:FecR family protein n=1 Tax=Pedobacter westerhofensis TaxID=425512 RepID=A0A521ABA6_9SPHI|nr:FecR family protein [Pedobacter westerhofensis]SMO32087.1 FecR family protein [Pedobacter westerhofensis]
MEHSVKQLFCRYIQNRATREEVEEVIALIKAGGYSAEWESAMLDSEPERSEPEKSELEDSGRDQSERDRSAHVYSAPHVSAHNFPELDTALLYQRINRKLFLALKRSGDHWIAYAAAVLILLAAGLFFLKPAEQKDKLLQTTAGIKPPVHPGLRKWIKLPDGTSVQLNADSKLDYPESFAGKNTREVTLTGEAFFDVKHDASHPFIIHTGKLKTTVLGTAFNISAYPSARTLTVTVTRGKVMVQNASATLAVLRPNQQLTWDITTAVAQKHVVNAEEVVAWKAQDLILDDVSLEQAADRIAARYKIKVIFKNDKVKDCRFTAAFLNRNQLSQVITVLTDITNASYDLKGNTLFIDGPGCDH